MQVAGISPDHYLGEHVLMPIRRRAFTLVEIMIVVLIIGVLLAVAVPQWSKARERGRRVTCLQNLKTIEDAKDIYALQNKKNTGETIDPADLFDEFIKSQDVPECPGGGTYTIGVVGTPPECSIHGKPGGW